MVNNDTTTELVFDKSNPFAVPDGYVPAVAIATAVDGEANPEADANSVGTSAEVASTEAGAVEYPVFSPSEPTELFFFAPKLPQVEERPGRERYFEDDQSWESASARRRTRRRSGDDRPVGDDPNTVVKVRQPREPELITEPQRVKGSTRLEAKKQRRRDGRDQGRRRAVVTESEFLARREAVDRSMIVREKDDKIQIGVLEDNILVEHYVARSSEASLIGNVYIGKVPNVLPSM